MIPKLIHYCWFGRSDKPILLQRCIQSWKDKCPDYQIIEWNEDNFDVNLFPFTQQAYEEKKFAFVSDVARLWIIYHHGGHYLDTDVELKQSLDVFSEYRGWMAADSIRLLNTGLGFGFEPQSPYVKCMLDFYQTVPFQGQVCCNVNTKSLQDFNSKIDIFDATRVIDGHLLISCNDYGQYATHYYTATWNDKVDSSKKMDTILKNNGKESLWKRLRWKMIVAIRRPKLVRYTQTHKGFGARLIRFFIFDLIDCGIVFCFKAGFRKLFRRRKK